MIHFPQPPTDLKILLLSSLSIASIITHINQFAQLGVLAVTFGYTATRFLNELHKYKNRKK